MMKYLLTGEIGPSTNGKLNDVDSNDDIHGAESLETIQL